MVNFRKKMLKNLLLKNHKVGEATCLWHYPLHRFGQVRNLVAMATLFIVVVIAGQ